MDAKPNSSFAQISGFLNTNWRHYTDFKHVFGGQNAPLRASFPHIRLPCALFYVPYALISRIQRIKCALAPNLWVILRYPPTSTRFVLSFVKRQNFNP